MTYHNFVFLMIELVYFFILTKISTSRLLTLLSETNKKCTPGLYLCICIKLKATTKSTFSQLLYCSPITTLQLKPIICQM